MGAFGGTTVPQRRRGVALQAALLDACWAVLVDVGYASLTMESVAARAHTGVAVLYRRWANKAALVLAAIEHHRNSHPVELPDTGALRGDLLAALTGMGQVHCSFFLTVMSAISSGLVTDTGLSPTELRDRYMGERRIARVRGIYQRAHDRREINIENLPLAVLTLPFDLVRHDLLMDRKPVRTARLEGILDQIVLPLLNTWAGLA